MELSDVNYLLAKRSVDDRALHRGVLDVVRRRIAPREDEVAVLDLGGGCGTMLDRLVRWGILHRAEYTLVDHDATSLQQAARNAEVWASVRVRTVCADLEQWLGDAPPGRTFDLVVCNAVLDLVDVPAVVPAILARLGPDGVFWPTINFDGDTIFTPALEMDGPILAAYHHSMDVRTRDGRPAGDARTGRHLFHHLRAAGGDILAAGSSDWVVFARDGAYPHDEADFLRHIIHTMQAELHDHPEVGRAVADWARTRRAQIDRGDLVYIAHQLDFAVTAGGAAGG